MISQSQKCPKCGSADVKPVACNFDDDLLYRCGVCLKMFILKKRKL